MAPRDAPSSASEAEDDAPETFSFNSSKRAAKGVEHARQEHEANERRKRKEANRERDRRLKERAEAAASTKAGKGKEQATEDDDDESEGKDSGPRSELEARMERAMLEADQESDEGSGGEDGKAGGSAGDGIEDEESPDEDDSEEDGDEQNSESESGSSQAGSDEEEEEDTPAHPRKTPSTPTYLPDDLFKAAFSKTASSSKRRLDTEDDSDDSSSHPRKQRKPAKRLGKDITVGYVSHILWTCSDGLTQTLCSSRTIRTLLPVNPAVPTTIARAMLPPPIVNKFVKRSLNLKGKAQAAQLKGWERRKGTHSIPLYSPVLIDRRSYSKRGCDEAERPCSGLC